MLQRLKADESAELIEKTKQHIDAFSRKGLRTLLVTQKEISSQDYEKWAKLYLQASTSLKDRAEKVVTKILFCFCFHCFILFFCLRISLIWFILFLFIRLWITLIWFIFIYSLVIWIFYFLTFLIDLFILFIYLFIFFSLGLRKTRLRMLPIKLNKIFR